MKVNCRMHKPLALFSFSRESLNTGVEECLGINFSSEKHVREACFHDSETESNAFGFIRERREKTTDVTISESILTRSVPVAQQSARSTAFKQRRAALSRSQKAESRF